MSVSGRPPSFYEAVTHDAEGDEGEEEEHITSFYLPKNTTKVVHISRWVRGQTWDCFFLLLGLFPSSGVAGMVLISFFPLLVLVHLTFFLGASILFLKCWPICGTNKKIDASKMYYMVLKTTVYTWLCTVHGQDIWAILKRSFQKCDRGGKF